MAARHTIWRWAGVVDEVRGRLGVLWWAFLIGSSVLGLLWLVVLNRFGVFGTVVLIVSCLDWQPPGSVLSSSTITWPAT